MSSFKHRFSDFQTFWKNAKFARKLKFFLFISIWGKKKSKLGVLHSFWLNLASKLRLDVIINFFLEKYEYMKKWTLFSIKMNESAFFCWIIIIITKSRHQYLHFLQKFTSTQEMCWIEKNIFFLMFINSDNESLRMAYWRELLKK